MFKVGLKQSTRTGIEKQNTSWFWVDAVVCSSVKVSFLHYLPGIFASLAALMFNCVRKEDISYDYYSSYGDSEWRLKLWLFIAYVVSFVSLFGAVGLQQDAPTDKGPSAWTGVAGIYQCLCVDQWTHVLDLSF